MLRISKVEFMANERGCEDMTVFEVLTKGVQSVSLALSSDDILGTKVSGM
jgi:hypothetical protein